MSLPDQLPILPLSDKVLLPSIITNYVLSDAEAKHLLRGDFIVCIPLMKTTRGNTTAGLNDDLSRLYHFGCTAEILKVDQSLPGTTVLHVQGLCRSRVTDILYEGTFFEALLTHHFVMDDDDGQEKDEYNRNNACTSNKVNQETNADQFRILCNEYITRMQELGIADAILSQLTRSMTNQPLSNIISLLLYLTESTTFDDKLSALETVHYQRLLELGNKMVSCHLQVRMHGTFPFRK